MNDRRQLIRWYINKEAKLKLEDMDKPFLCIVEDINMRGVKIYARQQLVEKGDISMNMDLGSDLVFDIKAAVAWHRCLGAGYVYGLYFTKVKDADKERLYHYIVDCCSEQIRKHSWKVDIS